MEIYQKQSPLFEFIRIEWANKTGVKYLIAITPEYKALKKALLQFSPEEPINFIFKISENNTVDKFSIKGVEKEVEIHEYTKSAFKKNVQ